MFYSLTGKIVHQDEQSVAICCGGVAFRCFTTRTTLSCIAAETSDVTLYTYLSVREDALDLFGFFTKDELEFFKLLLGVSGVGPKAALAILSVLSADSFAVAVASGDVKAITQANGVGPKLAQRIIMELKDKITGLAFLSENGSANVGAVHDIQSNSASAEAVAALVSLGYSQSEAASAVARLDPTLSAEDLIKGALKNMTLRF